MEGEKPRVRVMEAKRNKGREGAKREEERPVVKGVRSGTSRRKGEKRKEIEGES